MAGLVGSDQQAFTISRVGSGGFQNLAGRVGSGQKVLMYRGSDRGSGRVGSGRVKTSRNSRGSGRPDPTREVDLNREKP